MFLRMDEDDGPKGIDRYIKSKEGKQEIQRLVAKGYVEVKLSYDELIRFLGYEEARKVAFFVHMAEGSFEEGLSSDEMSPQ